MKFFNFGASYNDIKISKLGEKIIVTEYEFQWLPHIICLVPNHTKLNKSLL